MTATGMSQSTIGHYPPSLPMCSIGPSKRLPPIANGLSTSRTSGRKASSTRLPSEPTINEEYAKSAYITRYGKISQIDKASVGGPAGKSRNNQLLAQTGIKHP